MNPIIRALLPSLHLVFDEEAAELIARFEAERDNPSELHSRFLQEVRRIYDDYSRVHKQALVRCPNLVPARAHRIIRERVHKLKALIEEAEAEGEDQNVFLCVLCLCFAEDRGVLGRLFDPLDYGKALLTPLKQLIVRQAKTGFQVNFLSTSAATKGYTQALEASNLGLEQSVAALQEQLRERDHTFLAREQTLRAELEVLRTANGELQAQAKMQVSPAAVAAFKQETLAALQAKYPPPAPGATGEKAREEKVPKARGAGLSAPQCVPPPQARASPSPLPHYALSVSQKEAPKLQPKASTFTVNEPPSEIHV